MSESLLILPAQEIDPLKWDDCITQSSNSLIYAKYEYLTTLCDQWSGLIIGNYKAVIPLPWRKKMGLRYLYAPPFIQQLGMFGDQQLVPFTKIIECISRFIKFGDLFWNYQNTPLCLGINTLQKNNLIIYLNKTYPEIQSGYSKDLIHNLQKATKFSLSYSSKLILSEAICLYQSAYQQRLSNISKQDFINFQKLCSMLVEKNQCFTRSIIDALTNEMSSVALLLKDANRIYLILNATTEKGRSMAANHFLIDQILQEFNEEDLIFDFEGSEMEGIRSFYENFNPECQPYFYWRHNQLSPFLKWVLKNIFRKRL